MNRNGPVRPRMPPPPLPGEVDELRYETRNDAFSPATVYLLHEYTLEMSAEGRGAWILLLAQIDEVRLAYAPTRPEPGRYRCEIISRRGGTKFFNRRYEGVMSFCDSSEEYRRFVAALVMRTQRAAPHVMLVAGVRSGMYAAGWVGFGICLAALLGVAAFSLVSGLWWLVLLKALILACYMPAGWRWLRNNRETRFPAEAIPAAVLPAP